MKTIYCKVPYEEFAGEQYSWEGIADFISSGNAPFDKNVEIIYDRKRKAVKRIGGYEFEIKNPSPELSANAISSFVDTYPLELVIHYGDSHNVKAYPDGKVSFSYRIGNEEIESSDGMFYNIMKSERAMKKQSRKWAEIAEDLGFEDPATQDISLMGCNGLKVCTKNMNILPDDVKEYVAGVMLDAAIEHGASMTLLSPEGVSAHLNPKYLSIQMGPLKRGLNRDDIGFAYNALDIGDIEPVIKYPMHVRSSLEGARNQMRMFHENNRAYIGIGLGMSVLPGIFSFGFAADMAQNGNSFYDSALAGIEAGALAFGAEACLVFMAVGAVSAKDCINSRREEKKNERKLAEESLRKQAAKEAHYDKSGACVCIVPEKCMIEAVKSQKK